MEETKRIPVNYRYEALNWNFIKLLAEIASYAGDKYGSPEQYTNSRLVGEKSPINHIIEHCRAYQANESHDKFGDLDHQLAAIAYNAMMEYYYLKTFGPLESPFYSCKPPTKQSSLTVMALLSADIVDVPPISPLKSASSQESRTAFEPYN